MKKIFVILLFLMSSLSFSNEISFENYVNKKFGYSLKIPKGPEISKKEDDKGVGIESKDFTIAVLGLKKIFDNIDNRDIDTIYKFLYLSRKKLGNVYHYRKDVNLIEIGYLTSDKKIVIEIFLYNYKTNIYYVISAFCDLDYEEKMNKILEFMYNSLDEYPKTKKTDNFFERVYQ